MILPSIPYKGSKSQIAAKIMEILPPGDVFVDLFAGGGAMTTAAVLSHKYKRFVMNDMEPGLTQLYVDAVHGKYHDEKRWISREDFFRLRDAEPYVRFCWSFGNNGRDYLYGKPIEPLKKALHYASVFGDYSLLHGMGIYPPITGKPDMFDRCRDLKRWFKKNIGRCDLQSLELLQSLQSLQSLESPQSLQSLQRLQRLQTSYTNVEIPHGAVVYCDPPYKGTDGYGKDKAAFDHAAFYEWLRSRPFPVWVSEYSMPDDFVAVWGCRKRSTLSATNKSLVKMEKVFVQERWTKEVKACVLPILDLAS